MVKRFVIQLFALFFYFAGLNLLHSQTNPSALTVFQDNFNQAPVNPIVSSGDPAVNYTIWTTVDPPDSNSGTALIENYSLDDGMLKLLARNSPMEQTGDRTEVSAPLSDYDESFNPVLSENTDTLVWIFTAKQNRNSAGGTDGFNGTNTGMAVVLASDGPVWGTEQGSEARGYAVTFLKPTGSLYGVSLSRFDGGLSGYTVIAGNKTEDVFSDYRTWITVKVEYYPASNEWSLWFRDEFSATDKGDITDAEDFRLIETVTDDTFTDIEMTHFGFALNSPAPGAVGSILNAFWVDDYLVSLGRYHSDPDDEGEDVTPVTMYDEGQVAPDGLIFTDFQFGDRITPHGDCIKIHEGYIFVSWYRGGMDDRAVMLSRKKIGGDTWKHIEFPHQHQMFRGDTTKGDSHNTIAVGISPRDNTIHLLYDMHAYTTADTPDDFFNYSYSVKGAALVPDSLWTLDLFYPKQNYLVSSLAQQNPGYYQRVTYPGFFLTEDDELMVKWRIGGHINATMYFTRYDGLGWSESVKWNNYAVTSGFYGNFGVYNGKLHSIWSRRMSSDHDLGYINNRGLYYGYSHTGDGMSDWFTADGINGGFPIVDQELFKIAEPSVPGQRISSSPGFVITENGAFHAQVLVGAQNKHYYRLHPDDPLQMELGGPDQAMYAFGDRVYSVYLQNGRPLIVSTQEGTFNWREDYRVTSGRTYRFGNTARVGNDLFFYLMEVGTGDKQPIHVLRFTIGSDSIETLPTGPALYVDADASKGTVGKTPDKKRYDIGESVVLAAESKPGFRFSHWSGYYSGNENPLTVTMDSTIILKANFVPSYKVTISENTENGTVEIIPDKPYYDQDESIQFIPHPASGYLFSGWFDEGGIGGDAVPLNISINRDIELTAYFTQITHQLIMSAINGAITRNPDSAAYVEGTQVELTAIPDEGYEFTGWSGNVTGLENPITISMDSTIYVIANFSLVSNINRMAEHAVKIYPNPSTGIITLETGREFSYVVYNLTGISIKEGQGYDTLRFDLGKNPGGIYLLKLILDNEVLLYRIVLD